MNSTLQSIRATLEACPPEARHVALGVLAAFIVPPLVQGLATTVGRKLRTLVKAPARENIRQRKAEQLKDAVARAEAWASNGISPELAKRLTAPTTTIQALVDMQLHGQVTATDILKSFLLNAIAAHKQCNCIVELMLDGAIAAAAQADHHLRRRQQEVKLEREEGGGAARASSLAREGSPSPPSSTGGLQRTAASGRFSSALDDSTGGTSGSGGACVLLGPLHGIPISIKENISYKGTDATIGVFGRCFQPATVDAPVVTALRRAGAVVFVKTNVPQTLLSFECWNPVQGEGTNPYRPGHTPGGSSGGEAALLALNGSAAGIGSDIGGSIRIPAHFCGIYGLKPSQWRIANYQCNSLVVGPDALASVVGPMTRNLADLTLMTQVLANSEMWRHDGNVMRAPFRKDLLWPYTPFHSHPKRLRVGYYVDDGIYPATAPCERAVRMVVESLEKAGHIVVPYTLPQAPRILQLFYRFVSADGGANVQRGLQGDPASPHVAPVIGLIAIPAWIRRWILAPLVRLRDPFGSQLILAVKHVSLDEFYQMMRERNELRAAFAQSLSDQQLDCVIAPGLAFPALKLRSTTQTSFGCAMTAVFNVLDASVVALPVTHVDPKLDGPRSQAVATTEMSPNKLLVSKLDGLFTKQPLGDFEGLPVGVQVVGSRFSEEVVLGCASTIESALQRR